MVASASGTTPQSRSNMANRKRRHGVVDPPDISIPRPKKRPCVVVSPAEKNEVVEYLKIKGFAQDICQAFEGAFMHAHCT